MKVSEYDIKIHGLNNLPEAYDATVEMIEDGVKKYTIAEIKRKLNRKYQKPLMRDNDEGEMSESIDPALYLSTFKVCGA